MFSRLKEEKYKGGNEKLDVQFVFQKIDKLNQHFFGVKEVWKLNISWILSTHDSKTSLKCDLKNFDSKQTKRVVLKRTFSNSKSGF